MDGYLKYNEMTFESVKYTYNPQKTPGKPFKVKAHKIKKDVYGQEQIPEHENKTGDKTPYEHTMPRSIADFFLKCLIRLRTRVALSQIPFSSQNAVYCWKTANAARLCSLVRRTRSSPSSRYSSSSNGLLCITDSILPLINDWICIHTTSASRLHVRRTLLPKNSVLNRR